MNGSQFFLTTIFFGGAFTIICLYFDKYRHKDPYFQHKLKLQRKKTKLLQAHDEDECLQFDSNEDREARIFKEIELAENCMDYEDYKKAIVHFSNAIAGCVDPCNLIRALHRTLPGAVFDMLMNRRRRKNSTPSANNTTADKYFRSSGFPPGTTVDELFLYRRKKPLDITTRDNLKLEKGSYQAIKSEYKRKFHRDIYQPHVLRHLKRPEDSLKIEGDYYFYPECYDTFVETSEKSLLSKQMDVAHDEESESSDDEQTKKISSRHRHLFRRPTFLKLEGDFYNTTENAEKFVQYLLSRRRELLRHPTTLKLEGEMETKTENRDNYIPRQYQSKRPLIKTSTNLHMEGILNVTTENRESYIPIKPQPRTPLTKRSTNLHLEGDVYMEPEYKQEFVLYKNVERRRPTFPFNNLKTDGFVETETEKMEKFVKHEIQPMIPALRDFGYKKFTLGNDHTVKKAEYKSKFVEHPNAERSLNRKPKEHLKMEGNMTDATESKTQFNEKPASKSALKKFNNNLLLEGKIDLNPEYKNAYVNFYKDAYGNFGIVKDNTVPRTRRGYLKSEGEMETNPEYRSAFVDFPRQRPSTRKPGGHMQTEGNISNMTEKRAQFVEHPISSKPRLLKRQTELKLEGPIECYPEYRRAYIDYVTRDHAAERQLRFPEKLEKQKQQRIFMDNVPEPPKIDENLEPPQQPESSTKTVRLVVNKEHRRYSSLSPTPPKNLSNVENRLFGPKLPIYPRKQSRTEVERRIADSKTRERMSRARKRYGTPELVENLAYVSPVRYHTPRLPKDDSKCDKHSFVVLGKFDIESCAECANKNNKQLFKEQKWMPAWNSSTVSSTK